MKKERVFSGRTIEVFVEEVELPNGHRTTLDVVRHPGASAIVPFSSPTDVLLIRQYRYHAGGTIWEVPAGKLDGPEAPAVCAARELEEETGRRAGRLESLGSIWTTPGFSDEVIHLFAAFELDRVPQRLESEEVIEVIEMPLRAALDLIWNGELRDSKSVAALVHAARRVGALA